MLLQHLLLPLKEQIFGDSSRAEAAAARAETTQLVEAVAALQAEAAVATRVVETLTDNLERSQDRVRATEARAPLEPKPAQLPA